MGVEWQILDHRLKDGRKHDLSNVIFHLGLTEDEMISSIEDFITEYVEQALDAEYFKKITPTTSTNTSADNSCEDFVYIMINL